MSLKQFQYSYEQDVVSIFVRLTVGASGAVASTRGGGVKPIVKESTAGQYSITLSDKATKLLSVNAKVVHSSVSAVAAVQILESSASLQPDFKADQTFKIQLLDFAGAAVNLESSASLLIEIKARRSSVVLANE